MTKKPFTGTRSKDKKTRIERNPVGRLKEMTAPRKTFTFQADKRDLEVLEQIAERTHLKISWLVKDAIKLWLTSPRREALDKLK